jgi:hypothetical protein
VLAAPTTQIKRLTCYSLNRMEKLAANALTTIAIILVFLTRIMAIVVQDLFLFLDLWHGECRSIKLVPEKVGRRGEYVLEAEYMRWKRIDKG